MKKLKYAVMAAGVAFLALPVLADSDGLNSYRYDGHMMGGYGHGMLGGVMMLLFWGVTIAIVVLAVRWLGDRGLKNGGSNALDILKERLARGEIEPEEYETRRKSLEG